MGVPFSKFLADLLGASTGALGVWGLLRKQHKLKGAARVLRWAGIVIGGSVFGVELHTPLSASLGWAFLVIAVLFFLFPDISYLPGVGLPEAGREGT